MLKIHYAGDFTQRANGVVAVHQHIWGQVEYIQEGKLVLLVQNREVPIEMGDAVWLAGQCPHGWRALSPVRAMTFKFEWSPPKMPDFGVRSLQNDAWLQTLPRRVVEAWQNGDESRRASANCLLESLLWVFQTDSENEEGMEGWETEWRLLIEELNRASGPLLSISEMARRTHLSSAHFRRLFEARHASTPGHYQMEQRMERAWGLLQYTRLPISQVAHQSGFSDVSAFSKAFVRRYGQRPSTLRQEHSGD